MARKIPRRVTQTANRMMISFKSGDVGAIVKTALIARRSGDTEVPSAKWSWGNYFTMIMMGTADARGPRQWEKAGRSVPTSPLLDRETGEPVITRKGPNTGKPRTYNSAPSIPLLCPVLRTVTDDAGGEKRTFPVGFKPTNVFAYEHTLDANGVAVGEPGHIDLVQEDYAPEEAPPLRDVAAAFGIDVRYHPAAADKQRWLGRYRVDDSAITLVTEDVKVYFHELAHAAHARVLKAMGRKLKGGQDQAQEAVAELSAGVLAQLYGYDYTGNVWQYIHGYCQGDANKTLRVMNKCLHEVCETVTLILDTHDEGVEVAA